MIASYSGYFEIAEYLVKKAADINLKYEDNKTALIIAAEREHFDIVKYLLQFGAVITDHEIEEYLKNNGAIK